MISGCARGDALDEMSPSASGDAPKSPGEGSGNSQAGIVTAGEWNDLDHWDFWGNLLGQNQNFAKCVADWGFNTAGRVLVKVNDFNGPVGGLEVELLKGEEVLWTAKTDRLGCANLWAGLYEPDGGAVGVGPRRDTVLFSSTPADSSLTIRIDGFQLGNPVVSTYGNQGEVFCNEYPLIKHSSVTDDVEIAFVVDATGSMSDEIDFLKSDLTDIITKVQAFDSGRNIRTAALFYRDEGDDYLTRESNFTADLSATAAFIAKQSAFGGGDYPEAVHTALENTLQKLSWKEDASTKLAFLLLDAPAHLNQKGVTESLHKSIDRFAANGIKIIPVAASGVDISTEAMLRSFAIATSGTYVFITNDSGVGDDHLEASVGDFEVEQLNDLLVRLISYYMQ